MTKFILLAARRSGTTLLIDSLNSHPDVACVKRAFGLEKKIKNPTPDEHSGDFYLHRNKSFANRIRYYTSRYALVDEFLTENIFEDDHRDGAAGFRLIYEMAFKYPQIATWSVKNQAKVIHLVRGNCLKTYVSAVSAQVHKMRHPREGALIKSVKVRIDPKQLILELDKRTSEMEQRKAQFSACPFHEVYYEKFTANRAKEAKGILNFLEVDDSVSLSSDLVKINPDSLEEIIANYDEIIAVLQGTPYEKYLQ